MPLTFDQLEKEALLLPEGQRLELAQRLWDTIEEPAIAPEIEEAWDKEIQRRIQEMDDGTVKPVPGELVMENIRRLLAGK